MAAAAAEDAVAVAGAARAAPIAAELRGAGEALRALVGRGADADAAADAVWLSKPLAVPDPDPDEEPTGEPERVAEHYRHESSRHVEHLSAMARAALGPHAAPPTAAAAAPALEAASPLAAVTRGTATGPLQGFDARKHAARLPRILLVGGGADDVVPHTQSSTMAAALRAANVSRVTHVHAPGTGHADFVTAWGYGRPVAPWADALVAAVKEA